MKRISLILVVLVISGYLIPQTLTIPVKGASANDWHPDSFWYYPWGKSITNKGIDIFAKEGTEVISASNGLVIYQGKMGRGGNVVLVLSSKWRTIIMHIFVSSLAQILPI